MVWIGRYGDLVRFIARTDRLPSEVAKPVDGGEKYERRLGGWVRYQRRRQERGLIAPWQREHLDAVPAFTWDPLGDQWDIKGVMAPDWSRRYLIPTDAPGYNGWKAKSNSHQGVTVTMKRPEGKEADQPNPGGLKHEQHFPWGSEEWTRANGMRNGVESVNRNLKRSQYEDMADPEKRAVRGNTFTYLVAALATVVENLRQIISFYKRQLATVPFTAKNKNVPNVFWQSDDRPTTEHDETEPPG